LVIVLSVLLRYTDSDYPFGIFKLFFDCNENDTIMTSDQENDIEIQSALEEVSILPPKVLEEATSTG